MSLINHEFQIKTIRIPSKVFLFGEYVALEQGPALLYSGPPYFEFELIQNVTDFLHTNSPAHRWLERFKKEISHPIYYIKQLNFPYLKGGLGQSSAEFLAVTLANKESEFNSQRVLIDPKKIVSEFQRSHNDQKTPPSGYDLLAQFFEGFVSIYLETSLIEVIERWPFSRLGGCVFPTGIKLKTYSHLMDLELFANSKLKEICYTLNTFFKKGLDDPFLNTIREFRYGLQSLGREALETTKLIEEIESISGFLFAKGCGAMGADFVFCLYEKNQQDNFLMELKEKLHKKNINFKDVFIYWD